MSNQDTERAKFETWLVTTDAGKWRDPVATYRPHQGDGSYFYSHINYAWNAWQARATAPEVAQAAFDDGDEPERPRDTLCQQLQQQCSEWGTYWRASDAHGVNLSHDQAVELLQTALGVEVEVAAPPAQKVGAAQEAGEPICPACMGSGEGGQVYVGEDAFDGPCHSCGGNGAGPALRQEPAAPKCWYCGAEDGQSCQTPFDDAPCRRPAPQDDSKAPAALSPFTPAQRGRLYDNSPEHHKDATSRAAFERIVTLTERAHAIGAAPTRAHEAACQGRAS